MTRLTSQPSFIIERIAGTELGAANFLMPRFYKGVGVGTHFHRGDLRIGGIPPRNGGATHTVDAVVDHIAKGTLVSPYVSLTKSFGVARDYAMNAGFAVPTAMNPAHVYMVEIPTDSAGIAVIDAVAYVASHYSNPLISPSYHHDCGQDFLAMVIDPLGGAVSRAAPAYPPGMGGSGIPHLTDELRAIAFALRDAEVLVKGHIPQAWVIYRHDIY